MLDLTRGGLKKYKKFEFVAIFRTALLVTAATGLSLAATPAALANGLTFTTYTTLNTSGGLGNNFVTGGVYASGSNIYAATIKEPLGNEPQKSTQSCNLFRLNNLRESEAGLTLFHRFRS
jgi:hypothetical protein